MKRIPWDTLQKRKKKSTVKNKLFVGAGGLMEGKLYNIPLLRSKSV